MAEIGETSESGTDARADRQGIQSVEVAAKVLEALESGEGPMTLSEVAARCGFRPNKAHRYLVSLIRGGLASQSSASGRYDLGPAMRRIGAEALRRTNEVAVASEFATSLRDVSTHSVNLAVWSDAGPLIVRWDYGSYVLPVQIRVGTVMPLLGSAIGQTFLAFLPDLMTADALERSQRSRHAVSQAQVEAIKDTVRQQGYALVTEGSLIPGASAISAPVFTASDTLPLVMTIMLPGEELDDATFDAARNSLLETTTRLSNALGARLGQRDP